jgi:hypothetical protein
LHTIELLKANTRYLVARAGPEFAEAAIRCGKKMGNYNWAGGMSTRWDHSISGLHVANKQIHRECISFLYGSIAVFAQSSRLLAAFLRVVSTPKLYAITRLQLDHQTYGPPRFRKDSIWKKKEEARWESTCKLAASSLPNLHDLRINIEIRDIPLRFLLGEAWVQPFLHFQKLKQLENVSVRLSSVETMRTKVNVKDGNGWLHHPPWYVRMLVQQNQAVEDIHRLFGMAIAMNILGYCDDCALEQYEEAVRGRHSLWTHPSTSAVLIQETDEVREKHETGKCLEEHRSLMEGGKL